MAKTKSAPNGTSEDGAEPKEQTLKTKLTSVAKRAEAVEKNIGDSQSLRDFLSGVGWR